MAIDTKETVTVFGGSGFIGRYVVRALAKRGHRIRVASRRPHLAYHLQPNGNLGQIMPVQANLRFPWSVERAMEGAHHVVNLVGILSESGQQNFDALQAEGPRVVAEAAARAGIGVTQMSAIGADTGSRSDYARTKAEGEAAVLSAVPGARILRPSIVFGAEDQFFNRFANMARFSPVLPLLGGGATRFQPVFVGDVAEAVAKAVDGEVAGGRIYELGGPEVLTFREMMEEMLRVVDRKRPFVSIPFGLADRLAGFAQHLPGAPLTPDQVVQLQVDNVVSDEAVREGRTFEAFDIRPHTIDAILPTYLVRFRPMGQFTRGGPLTQETPQESVRGPTGV
ncbi:complex I NDUFA9 subunit family protein [Antarcticirhabdus aurantiaca]|uniref:Complex I NDUFA9 subunit family protein n=1 Tax=Antarcticirhabdus aurantiaca TaxID=2606717 RepID=A0ACD4NS20_9HYPH|nr:complex I NDUFA9 subunit family protein [Antarcticirhabdus aurantiaca]WAJ29714.1 complex I NDUFA9 subunit family protein [Jeongeuplla avenae]